MALVTARDRDLLRRLASWLPALAAVALFLQLARYHLPHMGDDAFIYFRYAHQLAAGHGPLWNPGAAPVEGYSSPLWLGLLSLGALGDLDLVLWSKQLGLLFAALAVLGTGVLARRLGAGLAAAGGAACLAATSHGLHYWAPAGLETALYAALFVWSCAGLARPLEAAPSQRPPALGWLLPLALLGLGRPEAPLLLLLALAAGALLRGARGLPIWLAGLLLLPTATWLGFRLAYYGMPLPNTFYAKAAGPALSQLKDGLAYGGWLLPGWLLLLGAAAWRARLAGAALRGGLGIPLLGGALLLIVVGGGGDWMRFQRLLVPSLLVFFACGAALASRESWRSGLPALAALLAMAPALVPPDLLGRALRGDLIRDIAWQEGSLVSASRHAASWIAERYPAGSSIAVNHAGALPYDLPQFQVIDMTGLNDAHIARDVSGALHRKHDADYVLEAAPRLVALNSRIEPGSSGAWYTPGYWEGETALVHHPEFERLYRPLPIYWPRLAYGGSSAYILLFERTP